MAFQKSSHFHVDAIINLMVHKVQSKGAIKMHVNSLKMSNIIEKMCTWNLPYLIVPPRLRTICFSLT